MTRKEQISVAKDLNISKVNSSFYRFADTYITGMKQTGNNNVDSFYKIIGTIATNSNNNTFKNAIGKQGKNYSTDLKDWSSCLLNVLPEFSPALDIDDIHLIICYATRKCYCKGI